MSVPTASPTPARYRVRDDDGGGGAASAASSDGIDVDAVVGGSIAAGAAYGARTLPRLALILSRSQLSAPCVCGRWDKIESVSTAR